MAEYKEDDGFHIGFFHGDGIDKDEGAMDDDLDDDNHEDDAGDLAG